MKILLRYTLFCTFMIAGFIGYDNISMEAAQQPRERASADSFANDYTLQPGDRIMVKVYPEDEYLKGGEMQISSEGNITLPLVGKIPIGNKSVVQAEKMITDILTKDYLVEPEVVIEVLEFKQQTFVILGQVKTPGTYSFPPGSTKVTLLQAISMAGGFSEIANIKKIKVMRKSSGGQTVIRANAESIMGGEDADINLEPGDIIQVTESLF